MSELIIPPDNISTKRLNLRRARPQDAQAIFDAYSQDEEITKYLVWKAHQSISETRSYLDVCQNNWQAGGSFSALMLTQSEKPQVIGVITSRSNIHEIEFGFLVARQHWNKGYMCEALAFMADWWLQQDQVFRVSANCHTQNIGSARVMEKAGFEFEGIQRSHTIFPNISPIPQDCRLYSKVK